MNAALQLQRECAAWEGRFVACTPREVARMSFRINEALGIVLDEILVHALVHSVASRDPCRGACPCPCWGLKRFAFGINWNAQDKDHVLGVNWRYLIRGDANCAVPRVFVFNQQDEFFSGRPAVLWYIRWRYSAISDGKCCSMQD